MIPSGYKQTEIGVIPEDWNAIPIGEFLEFKNGLNKGKAYFGYGTPIVNYTDTYKKRALKRKDIEGRVSLSKEEIRRFEARQYDVFFTRTSETPDEVGLSSVLLDEVDDCVFSGFILRGRPKNNLLDPLYCKYCFSTKEVRTSIITGCTYTTRALTNGKQLSGINILVPPLAEQKRIAEALSDVDELIASLEKLIEKKKALKQGVMQELLTGKRRLPGFSGEWEKKKLAQIFDLIKGTGLSKGSLTADGANECILYGELFTRYGEVIKTIISRTDECIGLKSLAYDVLMPGSTTTNGLDLATASVILKNDVILGGDIVVLRPKHKMDSRLFGYLMRLKASDIVLHTQGITIIHLNIKSFLKMSICIPSTIEEQEAIANVLFDIDNEIAAKENELKKYKQLKSGMMSELLTGRIRLV